MNEDGILSTRALQVLTSLDDGKLSLSACTVYTGVNANGVAKVFVNGCVDFHLLVVLFLTLEL